MAHDPRSPFGPLAPRLAASGPGRLPIVLGAGLLALSACLEPPELEPWPEAPPDLGPVDTWSPLESAGVPQDGEDGSPSSDSGASDASDTSGPDADLGADPPLDPGLAQLRISEVLADPEGADGGPGAAEILELKNLGDQPVILTGLTVEAASWPSLAAAELGLVGVELGPDEYLVIERWAPATEGVELGLRIEAGQLWVGFAHSGGLRNNDGSVELLAGGRSLDRLDYGPDLPSRAPGSGLSLCRPSDPTAAWEPCPPSPGAPNPSFDPPAPIPPGALVIVEVLANPPGPSSEEKPYEYIELINSSENLVELVGLHVGDAESFGAPGVDPLSVIAGDGGCGRPACLAPGARALLVGQGYLGETGDALVLATDDTTLADGGLTNTEPVTLWTAEGLLLSSYRLWPDPAGEPLPLDELPLHRLESEAADEPGAWISAPASPGH